MATGRKLPAGWLNCCYSRHDLRCPRPCGSMRRKVEGNKELDGVEHYTGLFQLLKESLQKPFQGMLPWIKSFEFDEVNFGSTWAHFSINSLQVGSHFFTAMTLRSTGRHAVWHSDAFWPSHSSWQISAILKIKKSCYLGNSLTDCHEIWRTHIGPLNPTNCWNFQLFKILKI